MSERRAELLEQYLSRFEAQVLTGPFAGMQYLQEGVGSELLPKLLGCYEAELHPVIEECSAEVYPTLLNVGCGEGYYAVGLVRRFPQAKVHAFDTSLQAQNACRQLAALNEVSERITVHGHCTVEGLRSWLTPGTLLLCDCEGGEFDLLQPDLLPALAKCDLLVELHDPFLPGVTETLLDRFAATHSVQTFCATPRTAEDFTALLEVLASQKPDLDLEFLRQWSPEDQELALSEARPAGMSWAYFRTLQRPSPDLSTVEPDLPATTSDPSIILPVTPAAPRITACILARNEEQRIEPALQSLVGWTDQILVIDNESEDGTAALASRYADRVLTAPRSVHFDAARNLAIEAATGEWLFFLDADERVPPPLGPVLRQLVAERGESFEALYLPFRHHMFGKWLRYCGLWPGYTRPQLLKKGHFRYNSDLHSGVQVEGRSCFFPADNPELALVHHSYNNLTHYFQKLNPYTDGEAQTLLAQGAPHSWQAQLASFVADWSQYYDRGSAAQDGMHGFVYSLLGAIYRSTARAKLWDLRRQQGEPDTHESLPVSVEAMLEFMLEVVREGPEAAQRWLTQPPPRPSQRALLLQAARGEQTALLDLTRRHHEAYAHLHGMEYECRFGYAPSDRHPGWDKIALLREVLQEGKYEEVFWLDADTLIVDPEQDLREALPPGKWLGLCQHGHPPNRVHLNNGVIYLRAAPEARRFLDAVWAQWPVYSAWEDQEALLRVYEREPERWPGIARLDDAWNSTLGVNESPRPVVLAWHGYGDTSQRLAAMQSTITALEQAGILPLPGYSSLSPNGAAGSSAPSSRAELRRPAANPLKREVALTVDFQSQLGRPLRVLWEGDQSLLSSLALVNREFCLGLLAAGDVELSLRESPNPWAKLETNADPRFEKLFAHLNRELSGPPDVTVRHHFPPNWERPEQGKLVVIQPWEYGHLPQEWVAAAEQADEVWAYSRFVRDVYARSGVPAERVRVVPLGFNPQLFTPDGPRLSLPTQKQTRFLFVGGAIDRKGADLLLEAYLQAFTSTDDVTLIVKDMGTRSFYYRQTLAEAFCQAAGNPHAPEILYLDDDFSDEQLAALYRACTCVVLPYRGEGFGLSPLEGLACGRPAIVTAGGPTDDYVENETALRVPYRRRSLGGRAIGPWPCVGDPWQLEPDRAALIDALRWVHAHPGDAAERGRLGAERVREDWTWTRAVGELRSRLANLVTPNLPVTVTPEEARPWSGMKTSGRRRKSQEQPPTSPAEPRSSVELSLCMIARDEEPRLGEALRSARPYVDEMIVVDTGSTDRTREVARKAGAQVLELPWPDSFAIARNASLAAARGEWLFWMDADDVLDESSGRQLRELIRSRPARDAAFQIQVQIPPAPGETLQTLVDHVKLFPNRPDLRFEYRIHEQILPACRRAGLEILFTDLFVTHQNYDRSEAGQAKKRDRDFRLLELDLLDHPDHPFVLFNLGMTYLHATREYEVAAHYLQRCLDRSDWRDSIIRKAYSMLATARNCQGEWEAAVAANEAGRHHYPDDAELLFQAGQLYQQAGRPEEARQAFQRLLEGQDGEHYRSVECGLRSYRGHHELALLEQRLGRNEDSLRLLRAVAAEAPSYWPAQLDLAEALLRQEPDEAGQILEQLTPIAETLPAFARERWEVLQRCVSGDR